MNVLETVEQALTPEAVRRLAETLGEAPEAVTRAQAAAVPAAFRLLTNRALAGEGAAAVAGTILDRNPGSALGDPQAVVAAATDLTSDELVEPGEAAGRIAVYSGVSEESAAAILRAAVVLALGSIARNASVPLGAENVRRLLRDQENHVERGFPPDFEGTGLKRAVTEERTDVPGRGRRMWPIAIAILVILLLVAFFGLRSWGDPDQTTTAPLPATEAGGGAGSAPAVTPSSSPTPEQGTGRAAPEPGT